MSRRLQLWRWLPAIAIFLIAGCASPIRVLDKNNQNTSFWSGRLALNVDADQLHSFTAAFELKGNAEAGGLALFDPLGNTVAVMAWTPGSASLRSNGQVRNFDSLDKLVGYATGTAIPVAALFDWLRGINTPVPGWQADLSQLDRGRLVARRSAPTPAAELRLVLEK